MTHGALATPHRLATEAGAQALRDGGNAIDAAVAANAVLCVVYPHMTSIGGDLFALVWPAGEAEPVGLEGAGRSGSRASITAMRERGFEGPTMPERGIETVTVPGTVQAWGRLLERFGTFGMGAALEAAVSVAGDGFVIGANLARHFAAYATLLMSDRETARTLPPLKEGMQLRQPDLASTLATVARGGWAPFYFGEVGQAIATAIEKRDGFVTAGDMRAHRGAWSAPIAISYRDLTVYDMPPPTQGLVALAFLRRLQSWTRDELEPGPEFARRFGELRDVCYELRSRHITDPDFRSVPQAPFVELDAHGDTVYLCSADDNGNVVSLIQSIAYEFGSGVVADGTGVLLQNRGCYFSLDAQAANRLEPNKRSMHTLIPALAARQGGPVCAFGTMAGEGQPQIRTQVAINLFDRQLGPAEAVVAPRIRVAPGGEPMWVEADYPGAAALARGGAGRAVELVPPRDDRMGHAQALFIDGPRAWRAGADPRSDGSVAIV